MSTTIVVDTIARVFEEAFDPAYAKQLDRGDTALCVATAGTSPSLVNKGTSRFLKTHGAAGAGRRSTSTLKDEVVIATTGVTSKTTVGVTAYHGYNDEDATTRAPLLLAALYAHLSANDFAEFKRLLKGGIKPA